MRRPKPKNHKNSIRIEGKRKVTFSRGRNSHGARIDGRKQILKKKEVKPR